MNQQYEYEYVHANNFRNLEVVCYVDIANLVRVKQIVHECVQVPKQFEQVTNWNVGRAEALLEARAVYDTSIEALGIGSFDLNRL